MNDQYEHDEEGHLIATIGILADQIGRRSIERVSPYIQSIEAVASRLSSIVHSTRSLDSSLEVQAHGNNDFDSPTRREDQTRRGSIRSTNNNTRARDIVSAMSRHAPKLDELLANARGLAEGLNMDERIVHLGPIFVQQGRAKQQVVTVQEQLLLACSCLSLSQDFADFERAHNWPPKVELLAARVLAGEEPACQAIGKHSQEFCALQTPVLTHQRRVDAAIRQGTKIEIIRRIGRQAGLGDALGLLAAFQNRRLDRLSYTALSHVLASLRDDGQLYQSIASFCRKHSEWWSRATRAYHSKHSSFCNVASAGAPTTNSACDRSFSHATLTPEQTSALEGCCYNATQPSLEMDASACESGLLLSEADRGEDDRGLLFLDWQKGNTFCNDKAFLNWQKEPAFDGDAALMAWPKEVML